MKSARVEENMVLQGKDGFLFLQNDTNDVIAQIEGRHPVTDRELFQIACEHAGRLAFLRAIGSNYVHFLVPDKETYFSEKLPPSVKPRAFGPSPFERYLASPAGLVHRPIYLLNQMKTALGDEAFLVTDTHWTSRAALWYLTESLKLTVPKLSEAILALPKREIAMEVEGDLGRKIGFPKEQTVFFVPETINAQQIFDNNELSYGRIRAYENKKNPPIGKILFIHDSFTEWMILSIAECAEKSVFIQMSELDWAFVADFTPNIVVMQQVERFFIRSPNIPVRWTHQLTSSQFSVNK